MSDLVVLHISDLHFGIENDKSDKTKYVRLRQKEMLTSLIDTIKDIVNDSPSWKPDIIAISGDISWTGQLEEYKLYKKEFAIPLSTALNISEDRIITCPGNHDIIRSKVSGLNRHQLEKKDSDVSELNILEAHNQADNFNGYVTELCDGDPDKICRLITYDEWPWVSFLSLNSAWDCRNDYDEGRLRVGLPLLENLIEKVPNDNYVITLFHHPHTEIEDYIEEFDALNNRKTIKTKKRHWLHVSEREAEHNGSRCFSDYVEQKSTFILNGHIHKETEPRKLKKSIQLISGTLYSNDTPKYHCRLLKLSENKEPSYCDLRRSIGDDYGQWEVTRPKNFQFEHIAILLSIKKMREDEERAFGIRLKEASEQFEQNKDLDSFVKIISEVASELMKEAKVQTDILNDKNTFIPEKTASSDHKDVLTLQNGE